MAGTALRLTHVALWTRDLARMRRFYEDALGGSAEATYANPRTGLESCFIGFGGGARVELMTRQDVVVAGADASAAEGYTHVAFAVGSREAVDGLVERLRREGHTVRREPRVTGDGYYEAVIADPDGNDVEIVA